MAQEYNALLKYGFQKTPDTSQIEEDLSELQQKKVTKFFSASDSLQANEIAQYQGYDDDENGLIYGYFYMSIADKIIPPNIVFYRILNNVTVSGVSIAAGDYYKIVDLPTSVVNNLWLQRWNNRYWLYNVKNNTNFVGYTVFDYVNKVLLTVTAQSGSVVTFDNGETADFTAYNGPNQNVIKTSTVDGTELIMSPAIYGVPNSLYITVEYNGKITPIVLEQDTEFQLLRTTEPIFIKPHFQQVDTQSRLQNIENDPEGDLSISSNLNVNGNLSVQGTQTTVHTQEIDSESDNINLRVNNPLGLENGKESGVKVLNYDGNNTNCFLGVDNEGWARVGDEDGTLQKLATIEDTPIDGEFVKYNTTTKQLESGTIPTPAEATTTAAGLMSAADKVKLNGIETGAQVNPTVTTTTQSGINCAKYGRLCFLTGNTSTGQNTITLPTAYKPSNWVYFTAIGSAATTAIFICGGSINPATGVLTFNKPILSISGNTISFNPSSFPISFSVAYLAAS